MTLDHPHLRQSAICPLCSGPKDAGLVACWHCYRRYGLRDGNPAVEARLDAAEAALTPRTELTPIGEQYVMPGCEKKAPADSKPFQPGLWD